MVSAPLVTERPAIASPFGLLADLGAAVGAELGLPISQIAAALSASSGRYVGDLQARGAIQRGRRELAVRRANPAAFRPGVPAAPPAAAKASTQPPSRGLPEPGAIADADQIEMLLRWAERGPQRAATLGARARVLLAEIAGIQQTSRRRWTRRQKVVGLPADATMAEKRAYFAEVRAWALRSGYPPSPNRSLSERIIRQFEAARAAQAALEPATAVLARPRPD